MPKRYSWRAKAYKTIKSKEDFEKKGKTKTGLFLEVQAKVNKNPQACLRWVLQILFQNGGQLAYLPRFHLILYMLTSPRGVINMQTSLQYIDRHFEIRCIV